MTVCPFGSRSALAPSTAMFAFWNTLRAAPSVSVDSRSGARRRLDGGKRLCRAGTASPGRAVRHR
jgi:hypothetical protein